MRETAHFFLEGSESERRYQIFFCLLLFVPCLLVSLTPNNDLWFLLTSGRYVLAHGIPYTEPFTMHPGMAFVMQQWLTATLFWVIYCVAGFAGLFGLTMLVYAGTLWILFCLSMRVSNRNFLVSYGVTLLFGVLLSLFMVTRPYIFTAFILAWELYLLESYIKTNSRRFLAFLPVLSLALINLHAAMWPMLFIVLLPYLIDAFEFKLFFIRGQGYRKAELFLCVLLMLLAGFANPYGIGSMTYLFRSYGYKEISDYINEMQAANVNDPTGKLILATFFLFILVYLLRRKGTTRLRYVLLAIGTAYMTLSSVRNYLFFLLCGPFSLAFYLKDLKPKVGKSEEKSSPMLRKVLLVMIGAAVLIAFCLKISNFTKAPALPNEAGAVNYLLRHTAPGRKTVLYTGYDEGGYAEFMGLKPYIDPRAEVFLKSNNRRYNYMKEYVSLQKGQIYYKNVLKKYGFTDLIVSKKDLLATYLPHDPGYRRVYRDKHYAVYQTVR